MNRAKKTADLMKVENSEPHGSPLHTDARQAVCWRSLCDRQAGQARPGPVSMRGARGSAGTDTGRLATAVPHKTGVLVCNDADLRLVDAVRKRRRSHGIMTGWLALLEEQFV